jgi:hypothetical protein
VSENVYDESIGFREEFAREIIKYSNIELIRKLNTGKRNGYAGFIGIKMRNNIV